MTTCRWFSLGIFTLGCSSGAALHDAVPRGCAPADPPMSKADARAPTPDARPEPDASPPDASPPLELPELGFARTGPSELALHPRLGTVTSRRRLLLAPEADARQADFDRAVAQSGCSLGGASRWAGIVQIDCGANASFDDLDAAFEALTRARGVATVAYDTPLVPVLLPPASAAVSSWKYDQSFTWGLRDIGAPGAWNLLDALDDDATVGVLILDTPFFDHDDLPAGTYELEAGDPHGTQVATIMGALWNASGIDGINPRVTVTGADVGESLGDAIGRLVELVPSQAPRVANLSLGYNWSKCHESTTRCDPRLTGRVADGTACDPVAVQRDIIAAQGLLFGRVVDAAAGATIFVAGAGNDSGTPDGGGCDDPLGDFPAELASPFNWAADHGWRDHVVVVEALSQTGPAAFSNVDGDVFAPGFRVGCPAPPASSVSTCSGTSFATALVAGAAAWLAVVEPSLTNAELVILLTDPAFAAPFSNSVSTTRVKVDLLAAALGIDELREGGPGRLHRVLADVDDGSIDGFELERVEFENGAFVSQGPNLDDERGDGAVDMKDFRRLRDSYPRLIPVTDLSHPKLDLNRNGTPGEGSNGDVSGEIFARVAIAGGPYVNDTRWVGGGQFLDSWALFERVYQPSADEPWRVADLSELMESADLHFFAADVRAAMDALGATAIEIVEIGGEPGANPPVLSDDAPLRDLVLDGTRDRIVTTPFLLLPSIRWRPVCPGEAEAEIQTLEPAVVLETSQDVLISFSAERLELVTPCGGSVEPATTYEVAGTKTYVSPTSCTPGVVTYAGSAEVRDVRFGPAGQLLGWRTTVSERTAVTMVPHEDPDLMDPCGLCRDAAPTFTRTLTFSRSPGCGGFVMAGTEVVDSGYSCWPPYETTLGPWCVNVLPSVSAGDCGDRPFGGWGDTEHWGLSGVAYQHLFSDGSYTHICEGPRCEPLDRVALGGPDVFTPGIEACYCEWGLRTSPPADLSTVPTWCGGTDPRSTYEPGPTEFPRIAEPVR